MLEVVLLVLIMTMAGIVGEAVFLTWIFGMAEGSRRVPPWVERLARRFDG